MRLRDSSLVHVEKPLGSKQGLTPEGFLLCEDVPIARTGVQEYLNEELLTGTDDDKIQGGKDGIIRAIREADDVFRPETLASFEGKDVVDDHPDDNVHPGNYKLHTVGVVLNPHQGEGEFQDFILADLLIKDQDAIDAVQGGKVEVSCGYDAEYEPLGPGKVRQHNIIGNHVALVDKGRCGSKCSIGDKEMAVKKKSIFDRLADAFKNKDEEGFKKVLEEGKDAMGSGGGDTEEEPNGAEGIHIHLHGTEQGGVAAQDEETEEAPPTMDERMDKVEKGIAAIADAIAKIGKGARDEDMEEEASEEEADPDGMGDEEPNEEETSEEIADEFPEGEEGEEGDEPKKEKTGDKKPKTRDGKTVKVKDSAHMKAVFAAALSGAEILAPGIKLPTFDSKAKPRTTFDSICLLRRRALAASSRTADGAEILGLLTGSKTLKPGTTCDALGVVFNGAVALMKDKNDIVETPKGYGKSLFSKTKDTTFAAIKTPADFNAAVRARYKQPQNNH